MKTMRIPTQRKIPMPNLAPLQLSAAPLSRSLHAILQVLVLEAPRLRAAAVTGESIPAMNRGLRGTRLALHQTLRFPLPLPLPREREQRESPQQSLQQHLVEGVLLDGLVSRQAPRNYRLTRRLLRHLCRPISRHRSRHRRPFLLTRRRLLCHHRLLPSHPHRHRGCHSLRRTFQSKG